MRIGVITCWTSSDNYGQQLQCWALQRMLKNMGHEPFLIRYDRRGSRSFVSRLKRALISGRFARRVGECIFPGARSMRQAKLKEAAFFSAGDERRDFRGFRHAQLNLSNRKWNTIAELREDPPIADCYITGSDQVWYDPLIDQNVEGMYLDFGHTDVRRVSYAASIGREVAPDELERFSELLHAFDYVSVRELGAVECCDKVGVEAEVALDPTLLLSFKDLRQLVDAAPGAHSARLFAYILNVRDYEELRWDELEAYAKAKALTINVVYSSGYEPAYRFIPGIEPLFPTIPEWLALVRDASCVVTSSYHGVVFSLLFHRPFVAIPLTYHNRANDRLVSLLRPLGLEERIWQPDNSIATTMELPIDWETIDSKLAELRTASLSFLERALS